MPEGGLRSTINPKSHGAAAGGTIQPSPSAFNRFPSVGSTRPSMSKRSATALSALPLGGVNKQCPAVNARLGAISVAVHKLPLAVSSCPTASHGDWVVSFTGTRSS